jgi:hypothetical protein
MDIPCVELVWKGHYSQDNLSIRGLPHDPICKPCMIHLHMVHHLLLDCSYTTAVRELIFSWNGNMCIEPPHVGRTINRWWDGTIVAFPKERTRETRGSIIYTIQGVQKERNSWVFRNAAMLRRTLFIPCVRAGIHTARTG